MREFIRKKKFQLSVSLIVFAFTLTGTLLFSKFTERHLYNSLIEQTLRDNTTIGNSVLNFIHRTPEWEQENYQEILQETCDLIKLPNNGYMCAVDSTGLLIAAPGMEPGRKAYLTQATFVNLSRDSLVSFDNFFATENFSGYYEYPKHNYSDIISTVRLKKLNLKILVHQSNVLIKQEAKKKVRFYFIIGILMSFFISSLTYFFVNKRITSYQKEINWQNQELKESNQMLTDLNKEKEGLTSIMAHDLKSPLNNIRSIADVLKQIGEINADQEEMLKYLELEAKRGTNLINDILIISKLESPGHKVELRPVHLGEQWHKFLFGHQNIAKKKKIDLRIDPIDFEKIIYTDENNFFRILDNLISNAIKYTPAGQKVEITIKNEKDWIIFEIKDEGVGIDTADIPKLFDKFAKVNTKPTGNESSTGLGLYIANLLAKQIGGKITVSSQKGIGSVFSLILTKRL